MEAVAIMAKKRTKPGGEAPEPARRATVLTVRGTPAWREWLERAANHCRLTTSSLVDVAVVKYVEEHGFTEPPPKR